MVAVCLREKGYLAVDERRVCDSRAWIRGKSNLRSFLLYTTSTISAFSVTHKTWIFLRKV